VTVTDGTTTKNHTVTALIIIEVDPVNDTVSGISDSYAQLWVDANNNWEGSSRFVVADEFGFWTADFSAPGGEDWMPIFDIGPGTWVNANQSDEDGDSTNAGQYLPNPVFRIDPHDDGMWGHEWLPNAEITVEIDDPATVESPDFTGTGDVVRVGGLRLLAR